MAILRAPDGRTIVLHSRHTLGRSRRMDTQVATAEASAQHAVLTWTGQEWTVRDLGSRNGTFHNGAQVPAATDAPLRPDDKLGLGAKSPAWVLVDASAPDLFAQCGDRVVFGDAGALALPSLDDPQVLITSDDQQRWMCSRDDTEAEIFDGETLTLGGEAWVLGIPEKTVDTAMVADEDTIAAAGLDFRVSSDEEYVEVTLRLGGTPHALPARAHHYLLLVMARQRLEDAEDGGLESSHGWLYSSDLQSMLKLDRNRFNLALHRARRELADLGIADAHELVQRRKTSQQIRLGVADLTVQAL